MTGHLMLPLTSHGLWGMAVMFGVFVTDNGQYDCHFRSCFPSIIAIFIHIVSHSNRHVLDWTNFAIYIFIKQGLNISVLTYNLWNELPGSRLLIFCLFLFCLANRNWSWRARNWWLMMVISGYSWWYSAHKNPIPRLHVLFLQCLPVIDCRINSYFLPWPSMVIGEQCSPSHIIPVDIPNQ